MRDAHRGVREAFAMATPDYLEQVVVSGQRHATAGGKASARFGVFRRPSVTSLIWAVLDLATAVVAGVCALRLRASVFPGSPQGEVLVSVLHAAPHILAVYVGWFALLLIFFARSYGLYSPVMGYSGLHEQRMTVQATFTAGLLLCGTLYLSQAVEISRVVVVLMIAFTT